MAMPGPGKTCVGYFACLYLQVDASTPKQIRPVARSFCARDRALFYTPVPFSPWGGSSRHIAPQILVRNSCTGGSDFVVSCQSRTGLHDIACGMELIDGFSLIESDR